MIPTTAIEATYTADGWVTREITIDLQKVLEYSREHGLLPIETEEDALIAAREAYNYPGPGAGLWFGRKNLERIEAWEWLRGWGRSAG